MELRALRLPGIEKGAHGPRRGGVHIVQQLVVQLGAGLKALPAALRLALCIHAKDIAGVVPQEVGQHAGRAGHRRRELHLPRPKHGLFADLLFDEHGNRISQAAVLRQTERIADGGLAPAPPGDVATGGQIFIQLRQRLQNHRTTS